MSPVPPENHPSDEIIELTEIIEEGDAVAPGDTASPLDDDLESLLNGSGQRDEDLSLEDLLGDSPSAAEGGKDEDLGDLGFGDFDLPAGSTPEQAGQDEDLSDLDALLSGIGDASAPPPPGQDDIDAMLGAEADRAASSDDDLAALLGEASASEQTEETSEDDDLAALLGDFGSEDSGDAEENTPEDEFDALLGDLDAAPAPQVPEEAKPQAASEDFPAEEPDDADLLRDLMQAPSGQTPQTDAHDEFESLMAGFEAEPEHISEDTVRDDAPEIEAAPDISAETDELAAALVEEEAPATPELSPELSDDELEAVLDEADNLLGDEPPADFAPAEEAVNDMDIDALMTDLDSDIETGTSGEAAVAGGEAGVAMPELMAMLDAIGSRLDSLSHIEEKLFNIESRLAETPVLEEGSPAMEAIAGKIQSVLDQRLGDIAQTIKTDLRREILADLEKDIAREAARVIREEIAALNDILED